VLATQKLAIGDPVHRHTSMGKGELANMITTPALQASIASAVHVSLRARDLSCGELSSSIKRTQTPNMFERRYHQILRQSGHSDRNTSVHACRHVMAESAAAALGWLRSPAGSVVRSPGRGS